MSCVIWFHKLYKRDYSSQRDAKRQPRSNVGIILRYNSTAEEVLALSIQKSRFSATLAANRIDIAFMTTPSDLKAHKFTFEDEEYGFSINNVYCVTIDFDENTK